MLIGTGKATRGQQRLGCQQPLAALGFAYKMGGKVYPEVDSRVCTSIHVGQCVCVCCVHGQCVCMSCALLTIIIPCSRAVFVQG